MYQNLPQHLSKSTHAPQRVAVHPLFSPLPSLTAMADCRVNECVCVGGLAALATDPFAGLGYGRSANGVANDDDDQDEL
jgi:hypothetical protein